MTAIMTDRSALDLSEAGNSTPGMSTQMATPFNSASVAKHHREKEKALNAHSGAQSKPGSRPGSRAGAGKPDPTPESSSNRVGEDIVDELLHLQLEKIHAAHVERLHDVKRRVHQFHLKKILHIKYLLEKLLKVISSNSEADIRARLGRLVVYANKSKLSRKLQLEMEEHIKKIDTAVKLNAHADMHHKSIMDDFDETAAIACIDNLKLIYRQGILTVFNYLEVIVSKIILFEIEARKAALLKFINCLQAPGNSSPTKASTNKANHKNNNSRSNGSDGDTSDHSKSSESSEESESEDDDEVRDENFRAAILSRDTLLGRYQILVNKLNNVIRIADVDVNCLCNVLIYLNTNIEIDIHASIDKEIV